MGGEGEAIGGEADGARGGYNAATGIGFAGVGEIGNLGEVSQVELIEADFGRGGFEDFVGDRFLRIDIVGFFEPTGVFGLIRPGGAVAIGFDLGLGTSDISAGVCSDGFLLGKHFDGTGEDDISTRFEIQVVAEELGGGDRSCHGYEFPLSLGVGGGCSNHLSAFGHLGKISAAFVSKQQDKGT